MTIIKHIKIDLGHWMTGSDWHSLIATKQIEGPDIVVDQGNKQFISPVYGRNSIEGLRKVYSGWSLHEI